MITQPVQRHKIFRVERKPATPEWYDTTGREHMRHFIRLMLAAKYVQRERSVTNPPNADGLFKLYFDGGV